MSSCLYYLELFNDTGVCEKSKMGIDEPAAILGYLHDWSEKGIQEGE